MVEFNKVLEQDITKWIEHEDWFSFNVAIANKLGLKVLSDEHPIHNQNAVVVDLGIDDEDYRGTEKDFCHKIEDGAEVIFSSCVRLDCRKDFAVADYSDFDVSFKHKSPLVAGLAVFLMCGS